MNSYEFEVAAKNAVIKELAKIDIAAGIADLNLVWFTHLVGNKKCMIWGECMGKHYAEVTYVKDARAMYVDLYEKVSHSMLIERHIDTVAHFE